MSYLYSKLPETVVSLLIGTGGLADVLARINDHAIHRLDELLPWNWAAGAERRKVAA
jgi:hypothetical protein